MSWSCRGRRARNSLPVSPFSESMNSPVFQIGFPGFAESTNATAVCIFCSTNQLSVVTIPNDVDVKMQLVNKL